MTKFFWKDASGVNADIERHRVEEKRLESKIFDLESVPIDERDKFHEVYIRTYRHFLCQLRDSKAEVVTKIGNKK